MGRPKKEDMPQTPTRERILAAAMELLADKSYDAVSIRRIAGAVGLNEASLYNHFSSKADLLRAIYHWMDDHLIAPWFSSALPDYVTGGEEFDIADFIIGGAQRFFSMVDRDVRLSWRILMTHQFQHEEANSCVHTYLLDAPVTFCTKIFEILDGAGRLKKGTDCASYGRILAALFFEYSFRANLDAAWAGENRKAFERLCTDIRSLCAGVKR